MSMYSGSLEIHGRGHDQRMTVKALLIIVIGLLIATFSMIYYGPSLFSAQQSTSTFYPDAHTETTSVDGYASRQYVDESWSTIHSSTGNASADSESSSTSIALYANGTSDHYYVLHRGFFLFDTSSIPDNATITGATLSLYVNSKNNTLGLTNAQGALALTSGSPASNTAITSADYAATCFGSERCATDIPYNSISAGAYNTLTLNTAGLGTINSSGISRFGLRFAADADNSTPPWTSYANYLVEIAMADYSGTTHDPKLIVTYTTPELSASITAPTPGNDFSGDIAISGTAAGADFDHYTLSYATDTDPATWHPIGGEYTSPVSSGVLATWDSTVVRADSCTIRLAVWDDAGNSSVATTRVSVRNDSSSGTYYPGSSAVDGYVTRQYVGEDFPTIRTGDGNGAEDTGSETVPVGLYAGWGTNQYSTLKRGYFLFDTSGIPDNAIIDSAVLSAYATAKDNSLGLTSSQGGLSLVSATPSSSVALVAGDYASAKFGNRVAADITYNDINASGYNSFALNAGGLSLIDKTGASRFGLRLAADTNGDSISWAWGANCYVQLCMSEYSGTTHDPKLVVSYHVPPALDAAITSPTTGTTCSGDIAIQGTAAGADFDHYTVSYATASNPGVWNQIGGECTTSVSSGLLATWDSTVVESDACTIRLTVHEDGLDTVEATTQVTVDNVRTITASAGDKGAIYPTGAVSVAYGDNQEFTITPDEGYLVSDVLVDDVSVGAVSEYEFEDVVADHTISASFVVETTAPSVNISAPGPDSEISGTANISGTASGLAGGYYRLYYSGTTLEAWNPIGSFSSMQVSSGLLGSWDTTQNSEGIYDIKIVGVQPGTLARTVEGEITPGETVTITGVASGFSAKLYDSTGIAVASSTESSGSISLDVSTLTYPYAGFIKVFADDAFTTEAARYPVSGNAVDIFGGDSYGFFAGETVAHMVSGITIDNSATAAITSPAAGEVKRGNVQILGTANGADFENYSLTYHTSTTPGTEIPIATEVGQEVSGGVLASWDTSTIPADVCVLRLTVCDSQNMTVTATASVEIDNTAPTLTVSSPVEEAWVVNTDSAPLSVVGSADDENFGAVVTCVAPGTAPQDDDFELIRAMVTPVENDEFSKINLSSLPEGPFVIRVIATDIAGNSTTVNRLVYKDTTAPVALIRFPEASANVSGIVTITGTAYDNNLASYSVRYASGATPSDSGWTLIQTDEASIRGGTLCSWDTSQVTPGTYSLEVEAVDEAGQSSKNRQVVSICSGSGSAEILINGGALYSRERSVTLSMNGPEGTSFMRIKNDSGAYGVPRKYSGSINWVLSAVDGPKNVDVQFSEDSDFDNATAYSASITLDSTPPESIAITAPAADSTVPESFAVSASAQITDGAPLQKAEFFYSYAGSPLTQFATDDFSDSTLSSTLDLTYIGAGYLDLYVRVFDEAGNSALSKAVSVKHVDSSDNWALPNHNSENTRYAPNYQSGNGALGCSGTVNTGTRFGSKTSFVAAVANKSGVQKKLLYQIRHIQQYRWGDLIADYQTLNVVSSSDDGMIDEWSFSDQYLPSTEKLANRPVSVADGFVYAVAGGSKIIMFPQGDEAAAIENGSVKTQYVYDIGETISGVPAFLGNNIAIVPTSNGLRKVNLSTKTTIWTCNLSSAASGLAVVGSGADQRISCIANSALCFVDGQTGSLLWSATGIRYYSGETVVNNETIYVIDRQVDKVDAYSFSGTKKWMSYNWKCSSVSCAYNMVFVDCGTYINALDATTGTTLWSRSLDLLSRGTTGDVPHTGAPAIANGLIYIGQTVNPVTFDKSYTVLYILDAFSGSDVYSPYFQDNGYNESSADNINITLAYGQIFLNWCDLNAKSFKQYPDSTARGTENNYCGFFDEVNTSLGTLTFDNTDISVPTNGTPLEFNRSYSSYCMDESFSALSSVMPSDGPLGPGWTHPYQMRIEATNNANIINLVDEDGSVYPCNGASGNTANPPKSLLYELKRATVNGTSGWILTKKDHSTYEFEQVSWQNSSSQTVTAWRLYRVSDDNTRMATNSIVLSYSLSSRPMSVTAITDTSETNSAISRFIGIEYFSSGSENGKISRIIAPDEYEMRFSYTYNNGKMTQSVVTVENGTTDISTTYTYYGTALAGNCLTGITDANGHQTSYSFSEKKLQDGKALLRVASKSDPEGGVTGYSYSVLNKTTVITDPDGKITTHRYDSSGRIIQGIDGNGKSENYSYGTDGLGKSIRDRNGNLTTYTMRMVNGVSTGELTRLTDALGNVTSYTYDSNGMVTSVKGPNPTAENTVEYTDSQHPYDITKNTDACGFETTYQYDPCGNAISYTEEMSLDGTDTRTTEKAYDGWGNLTSETKHYVDASGTQNLTTSYTYDDAGRMTSKTTPSGKVYSYTYDNAGRLLGETYQSGQETPITTSLYEYDPVGNKVSFVDANGNETFYSYDDCNRLIETSLPVTAVGDAVAQEVSETKTYTDAGEVATETDISGHTTSYEYDNVGRVSAITNPQGRKTTLEYDANGNTLTRTVEGYGSEQFEYDELNRVISKVDAEGIKSVCQYDAAGNKTEEGLITCANPEEISITNYEYDNCNRLTKELKPAINSIRAQTTYTYNGAGQVISSVDPSGDETAVVFDGAGRQVSSTLDDGILPRTTIVRSYNNDDKPLEVEDAEGRVKTFTYDCFNRVETESVNSVQTVSYDYDNLGNVTSTVRGSGNECQTTNVEYDELNRSIRVTRIGTNGAQSATTTSRFENDSNNTTIVTDPNGYATTTRYDELDRVTEETAPYGDSGTRTTQHVYSDDDHLTRIIDPEGNETISVSDNLGRTIWTLGPSGEAVTASYNAFGSISTKTTKIDNNLSAAETMTYDAQGRLISNTDPLQNTTTYGYDIEGNLISTTDPEGKTTTFFYDVLGNILQKIEPYDNNQTHATTYSYDLLGNKTREADGEGRSTEYVYDSQNRLASVIVDPGTGNLALSTDYSYDSAGNLVQVQDPSNTTVATMTYDSLGRLSTEADAAQAEANSYYSYDYDYNGNVTSITNPGGAEITKAYYRDNTLKSVTLPSNESDGSLSYTYDKNLALATATNYSGDYQVSLTRDASGRITTVDTDSTIPGLANTQNLSYNARGDLTVLNIGNRTAAYTYDLSGNVVSATDTALGTNSTYSFTYYDDSQLQEISGPGSVTSYTYYDNNLTKSITSTDENENTVASLAYTYDDANMPETSTVQITGNPGNGLYSYAYDDAGRLTGATNSSYKSYYYDYDESGNVIEKTLVYNGTDTTTYDYEYGTYLDSDSDGNSYSYDAQGNLTAISGTKSVFYSYNSLSQTTAASVTEGGNTTTASYTYDALGRMTSRTSGASTTYLTRRSTSDELLSSTTGTASEQIAWSPGGSISLGMKGSGGTVSSFVGNIHTDIVACISTSGTVSSSTLYSPYGELVSETGTTTNPLGYQSDYTDPLTGLIDMGVRNYDTTLSRFMTTDPAAPAVTDPESFNPYLYTDDAPLGRTDVTGQWWNPVKSAVGLGKKILNTGKKVVAPVVNHVVKPVVRATKAVGRKAVSAARWGIRTAKSAVASAGRVVKATGTRITRTLESGATALVKTTGMYLKEAGSKALADIGEGLGKLGEKIADGAQWVKDKAAQSAKWAWENRAEILKYGAIVAAGVAVVASGGTLSTVAYGIAKTVSWASVINTSLTATVGWSTGSLTTEAFVAEMAYAGLDYACIRASGMVKEAREMKNASRELVKTVEKNMSFHTSVYYAGLTTKVPQSTSQGGY